MDNGAKNVSPTYPSMILNLLGHVKQNQIFSGGFSSLIYALPPVAWLFSLNDFWKK
jgi:hypothetical protein